MFNSGAKNVISACRECKVKRLVYNSSADVVFDDLHNGVKSSAYQWKVRFCLYCFFLVFQFEKEKERLDLMFFVYN